MVKDVQVDKGIVLKRMMPRAFGRGAQILHKMSHVTLVLAEKAGKHASKAEAKEAKKAPKVTTKKPVSKKAKTPKEAKPVKKAKAVTK